MSAKDYFQDITPPESDGSPSRSPVSTPRPVAPETSTIAPPDSAEKSIRNIQITPTRRPARPSKDNTWDAGPPPRPRFGVSRFALWGAVALALVVLGALALVALRPTTVTVIPRSHAVLFDETARFTAYSLQTTTTGTLLLFSVETSTFEESQLVAAQGVERVEEKASGTITVYNNYSTAPVKLIKTTRFETPQGLVYRVPAEVVVPGKKGSTPGEISVTVIADRAGEQYNITPVDKFTLPGLKQSPDMYAKVYARSTAAMSGGFAGERPAAALADLEAARTQIRARLLEKVAAFARSYTDLDSFAFADLVHTTFESIPPTTESGGKVRIGERARVELPVFPADVFARVVSESVSANVENGAIFLKTGEGFAARALGTPPSPLSSAPLSFTLEGKALLIWKVDVGELAVSLAGRDEGAFQGIVASFPGIEEAHARIEPFWKNSFPEDPSAIKIRVQEPESSS